MKQILLTISLIFGATAVSAEPIIGKDAVRILSKGKIITKADSSKYFGRVEHYVILKDDAYYCEIWGGTEEFAAECTKLKIVPLAN